MGGSRCWSWREWQLQTEALTCGPTCCPDILPLHTSVPAGAASPDLDTGQAALWCECAGSWPPAAALSCPPSRYPHFNPQEMLEVAALHTALVGSGRGATPIITFNAEIDRIRTGCVRWPDWLRLPGRSVGDCCFASFGEPPWPSACAALHFTAAPPRAAACRYYPPLFYPAIGKIAQNFIPKFTTAYYVKVSRASGEGGGTVPAPAWHAQRAVEYTNISLPPLASPSGAAADAPHCTAASPRNTRPLSHPAPSRRNLARPAPLCPHCASCRTSRARRGAPSSAATLAPTRSTAAPPPASPWWRSGRRCPA